MEITIVVCSVFFLVYLVIRLKTKIENKLFGTKPDESFFTQNKKFSDILKIVNNTEQSVFVTGGAGTGKTRLLEELTQKISKNFIVLAPTEITAMNCKGQTIRSFFRFNKGFIDPKTITRDYVRADLLNAIDLIIIDRIALATSDLINGIDLILRKSRLRMNEPFGGMQIVFFGDLFQITPDLNEDYEKKLNHLFGSKYFFDAPVFENFELKIIELTKFYRQAEKETQLKSLLTKIRYNQLNFEDRSLINSLYNPKKTKDDEVVLLTNLSYMVKKINQAKISNLNENSVTIKGKISGKFIKLKKLSSEEIENTLPAPLELKLKTNAQVMMLNDDPEKRWINGSIGKFISEDKDKLSVSFNGIVHQVEKITWSKIEYILDIITHKIEKISIAEFEQYPLQLAYAITIPDSQGKTFDKITIDVGGGLFKHGYFYEALSRCRSIDGISLNVPISANEIKVDKRILEFYNKKVNPIKQIKIEPLINKVKEKFQTSLENKNVILYKDDSKKTQQKV